MSVGRIIKGILDIIGVQEGTEVITEPRRRAFEQGRREAIATGCQIELAKHVRSSRAMVQGWNSICEDSISPGPGAGP